MGNLNLMFTKLNRFLFFPEPPSSPPPWPSPSPSPSPFSSPNHDNLLLVTTALYKLKEWASFTADTLRRPDVFFSLLDAGGVPLLGATKAATIATLVLIGCLLLLSLFFFPAPTLFVLRWVAVSCFYICVGVVVLLCLICRWLFPVLFEVLSLTWGLVSTPLSASCQCRAEGSASSGGRPSAAKRPPEMPEGGPSASSGPQYKKYGKACEEDDENGSDHVVTDRQKMKESEEFRRAMEAEWAARQRELDRQAEEVHRQRSSKRAQNARKKTNERRKKQRVDKERPATSSREDEENLNLKDKIREEIRKQLSKLEKCCDLASLLRSLGIQVGSNPSSDQVQAAYKQACLKFHPDRLTRASLRQQVEAEEKLKLINSMKDKFSST